MSDDSARVSVSVDVPPAVAFELFTRDIDRWWRRGLKFRKGAQGGGVMCLEAHVGGRLFESLDTAPGAMLFEVGRVSVWEPPRQLIFSWSSANFAPHEHTEVQVDFAATKRGTLVTVTHRGLSTLRADHPVRHGEQGAAFNRMIGLWWGALMAAFREFALQVDP